MTNAEKFLKGGKATEELIATMENELPLSYTDVAQFWDKVVMPPLTKDERDELKRLCKKVLLSFQDEPQMIEFFEINDRFDYHESTNAFDLEIYIRKRKLSVDEMLKREPPKKYGTMELFE